MTMTKENALTQATSNTWYLEIDKNGKIVSIFEHTPNVDTVHHTHFKDKLAFLTSLGYVFKEHGVPTLESIMKAGVKPSGVLIEKDGFFYDLSKDVLENAKEVEFISGTAFFTLVCPNHTAFGSNGAVPQTVPTNHPLTVTLMMSTFILISLFITNGVAISLDRTSIKQK